MSTKQSEKKEITPEERLKELEIDTSRLRGEIANLSRGLAMARNLISMLLKPCPDCGLKMLVLDWNKSIYTLICDNNKCRKYRQPTGTHISKEALTELEITVD